MKFKEYLEESLNESMNVTLDELDKIVKDYDHNNINDKKRQKIRDWAAKKGYIRILSATQQEWTEEGIKKAKKELK